MRTWLKKQFTERLHRLRGVQPIYGVGEVAPVAYARMGGSRLDHVRAALADPGKAPAPETVRLDPEAMALLRSIDTSLNQLVKALARFGRGAA